MLLEALLIMVTSSQWKQTLNKGPPDTMPKQQLSFVVFFKTFLVIFKVLQDTLMVV